VLRVNNVNVSCVCVSTRPKELTVVARELKGDRRSVVLIVAVATRSGALRLDSVYIGKIVPSVKNH
jgi:hypothetical protein